MEACTSPKGDKMNEENILLEIINRHLRELKKSQSPYNIFSYNDKPHFLQIKIDVLERILNEYNKNKAE